jgi:hypothetical protein
MKAMYGEHPNFAKWLERMNQKLETLKQAAAEKAGSEPPPVKKDG